MLIKPCTYFYERYPATCKALRLVLVSNTPHTQTKTQKINKRDDITLEISYLEHEI